MMKFSIFASILMITPFSHVSAQSSEIRSCHDTPYDDTTKWNDRVNSFCGHSDQSPIDIDTRDTIAESDRCDAFQWEINTKHHTFNVSNNGYQLGFVK